MKFTIPLVIFGQCVGGLASSKELTMEKKLKHALSNKMLYKTTWTKVISKTSLWCRHIDIQISIQSIYILKGSSPMEKNRCYHLPVIIITSTKTQHIDK